MHLNVINKMKIIKLYILTAFVPKINKHGLTNNQTLNRSNQYYVKINFMDLNNTENQTSDQELENSSRHKTFKSGK